MSACETHRQQIASWSPEGELDLSDETALHLDTCAACQAAFDARFEPAQISEDQEVPADLIERVLPVTPLRSRGPRWRRWGVVGVTVALAAGASFIVLGTVAQQPSNTFDAVSYSLVGGYR